MLSVNHVTKRYGKLVALDDVSFEVDAGEFVFLVGPSGSGKSTLLRLLTSEIRPDAGHIVVNDHDLTRPKRRQVQRARRQVAHIYQDVRLLDAKSVAENVAFALRLRGDSRKDIRTKVPALLEAVGLADKAKARPAQLSGGQQQRVAVARALATSPSLLLCDEPTGNLDPQAAKAIMDLLRRVNRQLGTTVLMATHDDRLVDQDRLRVLELADGHLVRDQGKGAYRG